MEHKSYWLAQKMHTYVGIFLIHNLEGIIAEGIKNYECRFLWEDFPSFVKNLKNRDVNVSTKSKILIWFEQGVGDQIKYFSAINIFKQKFLLIVKLVKKHTPLLELHLMMLKFEYPQWKRI